MANHIGRAEERQNPSPGDNQAGLCCCKLKKNRELRMNNPSGI